MPTIDETLKARARTMRHAATPAERGLWSRLRGRSLGGIKFTRQVPVGPYIVDFAARAARLVVEIDGETHARRNGYDARRTSFLEQQGFRVIRFTNGEVMGNLEGVLATIAAALAAPSTPHPDPLPEGEREQA